MLDGFLLLVIIPILDGCPRPFFIFKVILPQVDFICKSIKSPSHPHIQKHGSLWGYLFQEMVSINVSLFKQNNILNFPCQKTCYSFTQPLQCFCNLFRVMNDSTNNTKLWLSKTRTFGDNITNVVLPMKMNVLLVYIWMTQVLRPGRIINPIFTPIHFY